MAQLTWEIGHMNKGLQDSNGQLNIPMRVKDWSREIKKTSEKKSRRKVNL